MTEIRKTSGQFIYALTSTIIRSEDCDPTKVYGISIFGKEEQAAIEDISSDYDSVLYLFDLIVEEELYPEHLADVAEDYLSDQLPQVLRGGHIDNGSASIA